MKIVIVAVSLFLAVMTITSCAGVRTPVGYGSATSAFVFTHMTFPGGIHNTQLNPDNYKIQCTLEKNGLLLKQSYLLL